MTNPKPNWRMPAEWERHEATWIAWPHNPDDWPDRFEPIPWVYTDIVRCLSAVERVEILVQDEAAEADARTMLQRTGAAMDNVRFHLWPTDRVWTRDSGPVFVREQATGAVAITDWKFNAWAKYDNWQLDDQIPSRVSELLKLPTRQPEICGQRVVLEGGSIDTNGAGVLLTTEECLLSDVQQRNPGKSRDELEKCFAEYLGIEKVIWLDRGIVGDDTHGHVDDITRFVAADTIVTAVEPDSAAVLQISRALASAASQIFEEQRLPASYANFYIANELVLVPTFSDPQDRVALNTLAELFPERSVVGIPCRDFIWGLGALHCMTQQQPAGVIE